MYLILTCQHTDTQPIPAYFEKYLIDQKVNSYLQNPPDSNKEISKFLNIESGAAAPYSQENDTICIHWNDPNYITGKKKINQFDEKDKRRALYLIHNNEYKRYNSKMENGQYIKVW